MRLKIHLLLIQAVMLWAAIAAAAPGVAAMPEENAVLPSDIVFNRPNVTDQVEQLVRPRASIPPVAEGVAPTSTTASVFSQDAGPVTAFRTLAEAAAAGVNPLREPKASTPPETPIAPDQSPSAADLSGLPLTIHSPDKPADRALWPAVFGAIVLLGAGFLVFVTLLTLRVRPRVSKPTE